MLLCLQSCLTLLFHVALRYECITPSAPSAWGLKLQVYTGRGGVTRRDVSSSHVQRTAGLLVCGLKLLVYAAFSY